MFVDAVFNRLMPEGIFMNTFMKLSAKVYVLSLLLVTFLIGGNVAADEETLECTLYSAQSLDSEVLSSVEIEGAGLMLESNRAAGVCVFEDGRIADKQYVLINRAVGDGSTGSTLGYSVYTMENGESISAQFTGEWGSDGFNGGYTILGGTGSFENATGDGTITGTESPWVTTGIVKIVLNVNTP